MTYFIIFYCLSIVFSCNAFTQDMLNKKVIQAIIDGDLIAAQKAIHDGGNVHVDDDFVLRWSAARGQVHIVSFLLELPENQRADIHALDDWALFMAARHLHWPVVICLLRHGADQTKLTSKQLQHAHNFARTRELFNRYDVTP